MNQNLIFLPVAAQVFLVLILFVLMSRRKALAMERKEVDESRRALFAEAWPDYVIKVNNCVRNQSEVPVLFYVTCMALWALQAVDLLVLSLAWLFVASRYVHAYIHTGINIVPYRRKVFTFGFLLVAVMNVLVVIAALR